MRDFRQLFTKSDSASALPNISEEQLFEIDYARPLAKLRSKFEKYRQPSPIISSSLSDPAPNSLSPRSSTRYKDMAYHWLDMYLIVPAEDTLGETIWDMIYEMDKWSN